MSRAPGIYCSKLQEYLYSSPGDGQFDLASEGILGAGIIILEKNRLVDWNFN